MITEKNLITKKINNIEYWEYHFDNFKIVIEPRGFGGYSVKLYKKRQWIVLESYNVRNWQRALEIVNELVE